MASNITYTNNDNAYITKRVVNWHKKCTHKVAEMLVRKGYSQKEVMNRLNIAAPARLYRVLNDPWQGMTFAQAEIIAGMLDMPFGEFAGFLRGTLQNFHNLD